MDPAAGDCWTRTAIDADSKVAIAYLVGTRDGFCALMLMRDLGSCIVADETQLTTDQLSISLKAVARVQRLRLLRHAAHGRQGRVGRKVLAG